MRAPRPNVLLIVIDCARADRWLGPARPCPTPTMDALARSGASFSTAVAETSCTPPCFAGLFTGAYSFRHGVAGVGGYRVADELPTLAEVLRDAGYHTYMEATGPLLPLTGLHRGFDEYNYRLAVEYLHTQWGRRFLDRLRGGGFRSPWFIVLHLWELHLPRQVLRPFRSRRFGRTPYDRAVASLDARLAELVRAAGADVFTVVTGDHGEKTAAETYRPGTAVVEAARLYGIDRSPLMARLGPHWVIGPVATQMLRARFQARLEGFSQRETPRPLGAGRWRRLRDAWTLRSIAPPLRWRDVWKLRSLRGRAELAEATDALDANAVRRRIDRLVARIGDDALFTIYLRTWAAMLRLHLLAGHVVHVYDFLVRVPLVLHWLGVIPSAWSSDRMVRQVDIAATILDAIGVRPPPGFSPDGHSLTSVLAGDAGPAPPAYLSVGGQPRDLTLRGVRTESHKLVYGCADSAVPVELYDLRRDPQEHENLAASEPALVASLRELAERMIPPGGPRVCRLSAGSSRDEIELTKRLRDLGYI